MRQIKIRNGGFERADTEFWEVSKGALNINEAVVHRGNYSGKGVTNADGDLRVLTKDYIKCNPDELYSILVWLNNHDVTNYGVYLDFYDENGDNIDNPINIGATSTTDAWEKIGDTVIIPAEAFYCRVYIYGAGGAEGEYGYVDAARMVQLTVEDLMVYEEGLIAVINEDIKHTVTGEEVFSGIWEEAEYVLDVTSFAETGGVDPVTLDVKIETYEPYAKTWHDAIVFQTIECPAGGTTTAKENKTLLSGLGWKQRVTYTTAGAGTVSNLSFRAGVVYKR